MDSLQSVHDDYAMDPSLARLRRLGPLVWNGEGGQADLVVLVDTPKFLEASEFRNLQPLFGMSMRLVYVIKFWEGLSGLTAAEWQAAKALVAREVALARPRAWLPVGPVACELLGAAPWQPVVAAIAVAYTRGGAPIVQGRWADCKATLDVLLDEEAGFARRG